jgi:hypothetical protein
MRTHTPDGEADITVVPGDTADTVTVIEAATDIVARMATEAELHTGVDTGAATPRTHTLEAGTPMEAQGLVAATGSAAGTDLAVGTDSAAVMAVVMAAAGTDNR